MRSASSAASASAARRSASARRDFVVSSADADAFAAQGHFSRLRERLLERRVRAVDRGGGG
jgi:hypothetical protein